MIEIKKILYPTDFSKSSEQALLHALFFAQKYKAELHVLHTIFLYSRDIVVSEIPDSLLDDFYAVQENEADNRLRNLISIHQKPDLKMKMVLLRSAKPASAIIDYAEKKSIDLIVMGTHKRHAFEHIFLGSTAEAVVRQAYCPVLTIRECDELKQVKDLNKILVPVDFSEHSQSALVVAKEVAKIYNAELQLLHVIEETILPAFYGNVFESVFDLKRKTLDALKGMLKKSVGPDVKVTFHAGEGHVARQIVKFAETSASDLVIITTHGLSGIEHFLLGSVAEKVVRKTACPVLAIKAFGKSIVRL
jgi:nucleotide-binding universal stress UspA family protein